MIYLQFNKTPVECKNLKSIHKNPQKAFEKIQSEIDLNRISGPYDKRPISRYRRHYGSKVNRTNKT
jgi:hypothetical protein